jgi:transposase-like protein
MNLIEIFKKFPNQEACIKHLELKRWKGEKAICTYCGSSKTSKHLKRHQCQSCYKSFSVLVGTIFEDTNLPLQKWFLAIALFSNAKKGISALQLSRDIDTTYKTAWSISRKIRLAMKEENADLLCGLTQIDDTYIKTKKDDDDKRDGGSKKKLNNTPVFAMSNNGKINAFKVNDLKASTILEIVMGKVKLGSTIHSDSAFNYDGLKLGYNHKKVKHAVEFVSKNKVHTNGVETFWSLLKRGIRGNFHHISKKYLQDYINEFQFRFNRRAFKSEVIFDEILNNMLGVK